MKNKKLKIVIIIILSIILVIFGAMMFITSDLYNSLKESPNINESYIDSKELYEKNTEIYDQINDIEYDINQKDNTIPKISFVSRQ